MMKQTIHAHFEHGRLVMTPTVPRVFEADEIFSCVTRHFQYDWGDLSDADWHANNQAATDGGRIVSAYKVRDNRLLMITEEDRSATTLMLAKEY